MREVLADLTQASRFKELDRKCKKGAKTAGFNRLFSPMSSHLSVQEKLLFLHFQSSRCV